MSIAGSGVPLGAPFAGWVTALDHVPDAVFAGRMMGDGIAIDPLEPEVRAPCDAVVVAIAPTRHSITLDIAGGAQILVHVGLDTVALGGDGFEALVGVGDRVDAGAALLRVDLDRVLRGATSLISPIVVVSEGFGFRARPTDRRVAAGEPLGEVVATTAASEYSPAGGVGERVSEDLIVRLAHGLHARPAARIGAALKPFAATVRIAKGDRAADARSVVALLGLGVTHGDRIAISATGTDARAAGAALVALIDGGMGEDGPPAPAAPSPVAAPVGAPMAAATDAPGSYRGITAAPGKALGVVCHLHVADPDVSERADDPVAERATLDRAITGLAHDLTNSGGGDGIAEAHAALLSDPVLIGNARARITDGASAGAAWRAASREQEAAIRATGDARLIERTADLRDVERRVVARTLGQSDAPIAALPADAIVIAEDLYPSQFAALDSERLAGICTTAGGPTSHVAILAASAGVPMLVAANPDVATLDEGARLLLDADTGLVRLIDDAALADAGAMVAAYREDRRLLAEAAHEPCVMADGARIEVFANCGSVADAGAEGCGLLRTEFLFLNREEPPGEDEQAARYAAVADALGGRPLIVRTMDVGGDKPVPFLRLPAEDNPVLGVRGFRVSLDRPDLLRTQFRAILRGVPADQCRIMLPMVVDVAELCAAKALLADCAAAVGVAVPPLGIMVETPAAALLADSLAEVADFLSVGSNDLTQYALAADRGNPRLAARIDPLHPAVLRLIDLAARHGAARNRWIGVCGGVASDPAAAAVLIGLGITELSAAAGAVPAVKAAVRRLDRDHCRALATRALACATAAEVRAMLTETR